MRASDADQAIDGMLGRLEKAVNHVQLPKGLASSPDNKQVLKEMVGIIRSRLGLLE